MPLDLIHQSYTVDAFCQVLTVISDSIRESSCCHDTRPYPRSAVLLLSLQQRHGSFSFLPQAPTAIFLGCFLSSHLSSHSLALLWHHWLGHPKSRCHWRLWTQTKTRYEKGHPLYVLHGQTAARNSKLTAKSQLPILLYVMHIEMLKIATQI